MAHRSFVRTWSKRFFRYAGSKIASDRVINTYVSALKQAHSGSWTRLVLDPLVLSRDWQVQPPLQNVAGLEPVLSYVEQVHGHPTLLRPRHFFDVSAGVQVWFSHEEDLTVWRFSGVRMGQMRMFTAEEFEADVRFYLGSPDMGNRMGAWGMDTQCLVS